MTDSTSSQPLSSLVGDASGPLDWGQTWPLFKQLLEAVGSLHERGLVHGQLSTSLFEVGPDGLLSDQTISTLEQGAQARLGGQAPLATSPYSAPEFAGGDQLADPRVDVYALGVILYEMLTGRLPWTDDLSPETLLERKSGSKLPNPARYQKDIPAGVLKALRASTSGDPRARPGSAGVFRAVLGPSGLAVEEEQELSSLALDSEPDLLSTDERPKAERPERTPDSLSTQKTAVLSRQPRPQEPEAAPEAAPEADAAADDEDETDSTEAGLPGQTSHVETTLMTAAQREVVAELSRDPTGSDSPAPPVADETQELPSAVRAGDLPQLEDDTETDSPPPTIESSDATPRKKQRRKKKKKSRSGLLMGLVLGLGVVVIVVLLGGILTIRKLAQTPGPDPIIDALNPPAEPDTADNELPDNPETTNWNDFDKEPGVVEADGETTPSPEGVEEASTTPEPKTPAPSAKTPSRESDKSKQRTSTRSESSTPKPPKAPSSSTRVTPSKDSRTSATVDAKPPTKAPDGPRTAAKLARGITPKGARWGTPQMFSVHIPDVAEGAKFSVNLRIQCAGDGGKWRRYTMKRVSRTEWERRINFDMPDVGNCKYYFTAKPKDGGGTSTLGSKGKPFPLKVR